MLLRYRKGAVPLLSTMLVLDSDSLGIRSDSVGSDTVLSLSSMNS